MVNMLDVEVRFVWIIYSCLVYRKHWWR